MTLSADPAASDPPSLSRGQWLLLFVLAALQFMHTVDFVIVMPLAPHLKNGLGISTQQFGFVVSAYGAAACAAGLLLAPWLDRFDRKRTLLTLFAGFTLGTLLCAVAPDYPWLLAGRALAGGFGGIVAANVMAIVGDAFPDRRRGLATGVVMSAFSVSSIVGVPAGLLLTQAVETWRAPFYALAVGSALVWLFAVFVVPPLRSHLGSPSVKTPVSEVFLRLWGVLSRPGHVKAFAVMTLLVFGGFLMIPFIADFLLKNVGISNVGLQLMYVLGGVSTLVSMNVVGRLADRYPRLLLFRVLGLLALGPLFLITVLPHGTPLAVVLLVTTTMMILTSGRMVPLTAVITGIAPPQQRGTFMSILASVQQLGAAMGPVVASFLMGDTSGDEPLVGYGRAGLASVVVGLGCVALVGVLKPARRIEGEATVVPVLDVTEVAVEAAHAEAPLSGPSSAPRAASSPARVPGRS